jgi:hypothetical protein
VANLLFPVEVFVSSVSVVVCTGRDAAFTAHIVQRSTKVMDVKVRLKAMILVPCKV